VIYQIIKGIIAFLLLGYLSPKSFLYLLCFFTAQSSIWKAETAKNK